MGLVGWICPVTREKVEFGHFNTCGHGIGGRSCVSPALAAFAEAKALEDVRHAGMGVTATRTMGCPRATAIECLKTFHGDPRRVMLASRGSAAHEAVAKALDSGAWYTEANDPMRLVVEGVLFKGLDPDWPEGVKVSAMMDGLRRDLTEIVDWKFPKDWSVKFRRGRGNKGTPEHGVQLNIIRLLLAQQEWAIREGYDPEKVKMTIWDHGFGMDLEGPEPMVVGAMSEGEILDVRPWGGQVTVRDRIGMLVELQQEMEGPVHDPDALLASAPLVGEKDMNGKRCGACLVEAICTELVRVHGRPE
jgi:hypothetical protein